MGDVGLDHLALFGIEAALEDRQEVQLVVREVRDRLAPEVREGAGGDLLEDFGARLRQDAGLVGLPDRLLEPQHPLGLGAEGLLQVPQEGIQALAPPWSARIRSTRIV